MKLIISLITLFLFCSCSKTKNEENKLLIPKNNFSVSAFQKKLDSLNKNYAENDSLKIPLEKYDKRLNQNYLHGKLHFLILDNNTSYYVLDTLIPPILMCGNRPDFSKQDSLNFIKKNNKFIDLLQPIKTFEIVKILKQNQKLVANKEYNSPLNVSFGFKNDTLSGTTMYNIINFMEDNGMKSYTIRRMNEYEIMKTK
ncbi:hypothetical protein PFY12_15640 [Chryseobacterium camelliae]|uniref:Uncharacterized protein n=1 Tax=Chryseobacterium camelliae TaxID=1265445 RepID=A0ABY7QLA9_9FLAO|nr:hypothetical protein [Chryseobacterium camelliae]WBV60452.1 hypothetical protein PFY12_15640 [Chryseobacterium camelliae]